MLSSKMVGSYIADYPRRYGRSRSLVRLLSSLLPLRPAPRIFFHVVKKPMHMYHVETENEDKEINLKNVPGQTVFFQNSPSAIGIKPDLLEFGPTTGIQDSCDSNVNIDGVVTQKIDNLEKELKELREQMSRIMAAQMRPDPAVVRTIPAPPSLPSTGSIPSGIPAPPPPPPPPPPPLPPPQSLSVPRLVIQRSNKDGCETPKLPASARIPRPIDMSDVLKDMGKVKLRRIERSPGGTPLRLAPPPSDPNTVLMHVLKKRYAAMHDKTPERGNRFSDRCNDSDTSFTEESLSPLITC